VAKLVYLTNASLDGYIEDDRPAEILQNVPLRTAPLRDDVRVGNQPCPRQAVARHGRLRERLAGSGRGLVKMALACKAELSAERSAEA
jgi:hypothetical protein